MLNYLPKEHPLYEKNQEFIRELLLEVPFSVDLNSAITSALENTKLDHNNYLTLYPFEYKDLIYGILDHIIIQTEKYYSENKDDLKGIKKSLHTMIMFGFRLYPNMNIVLQKILPETFFKVSKLYSSNLLWNFSDNLWVLAGDRSTDYNYYTKRFLLSNIYLEALIFSLQDNSKNLNDTSDFIIRSFDKIKIFEKIKKKMPNISNLQEKIFSVMGKARYKWFEAKL